MATTLSKTKTWQCQWNLSNTISTVEATDCSDLFLRIKNALKSFGSNPWVVVGSSKGSAAGMDGVDRLVVIADIVKAAAGVNHSWIVLKQTGISSNFSVCFDFNNAGGNVMSVIVSPGAGFTGGSQTNRPTATDERVELNQDFWLSAAGSLQYRAHVLQSTDGQCTRIFVHASGHCILFFMMDKAKNPVPSWTNPAVYGLRKNGIGNFGDLTLLNVDSICTLSAQLRAIAPSGTLMPLICTTEGLGGGGAASPTPLLFQFANELEATAGRTVYHYCSVGLMHTTTVGMRGRHGEIYDLWFASRLLNDADTVPNDGSKQYVVFGDMIVPNDGTSVLVS